MPTSVAGLPLKLVVASVLRSPSVTSATSPTRTALPSADGRTMMLAKSSGRSRRPCVEMLSCSPGVFRHRLPADTPDRRLNVLAAQRRHDDTGRQVQRSQPVHVEVDSHRKLVCAEHRGVADPLGALQRVEGVELRIIGQVAPGDSVVLGKKGNTHQQGT